jgi:hypothetical protein
MGLVLISIYVADRSFVAYPAFDAGTSTEDIKGWSPGIGSGALS